LSGQVDLSPSYTTPLTSILISKSPLTIRQLSYTTQFCVYSHNPTAYPSTQDISPTPPALEGAPRENARLCAIFPQFPILFCLIEPVSEPNQQAWSDAFPALHVVRPFSRQSPLRSVLFAAQTGHARATFDAGPYQLLLSLAFVHGSRPFYRTPRRTGVSRMLPSSSTTVPLCQEHTYETASGACRQ
jgi:hypothetical protein